MTARWKGPARLKTAQMRWEPLLGPWRLTLLQRFQGTTCALQVPDGSDRGAWGTCRQPPTSHTVGLQTHMTGSASQAKTPATLGAHPGLPMTFPFPASPIHAASHDFPRQGKQRTAWAFATALSTGFSRRIFCSYTRLRISDYSLFLDYTSPLFPARKPRQPLYASPLTTNDKRQATNPRGCAY
ncbi:hypothetical protein BBAD15_g6673 [Beauveria bassiana D1-5]|uniref:Uncharacterized protein n=1 Tax=Beauveria bassiana D1-5 TaxID=1245745 RepID=A0A0A2VJD4_BEABA|nr:hypothetical protein BBAD15_g6673 [Beauveria bassiana D1-5]